MANAWIWFNGYDNRTQYTKYGVSTLFHFSAGKVEQKWNGGIQCFQGISVPLLPFHFSKQKMERQKCSNGAGFGGFVPYFPLFLDFIIRGEIFFASV